MLQLAVEEGCAAAAIALGAVILLLLLGTQILEWYWPAAVLIAALAAALLRIRKRLPEPYRLLQRVDRRLSLHDSLSTAFFFSSPAGGRGFPEHVCQAQRQVADRLSEATDPRAAAPFRFPSAAYAAILTFIAAGTLLAIRYGVQHSLDLRPPIVAGVVGFFRPVAEIADLKEQPKPSVPEEPTALPVRDERRQGDRDKEPPVDVDELQSPAHALDEHGQPLREGQSPENADAREEAAKEGREGAGEKGDENAPPAKSAEQSRSGAEERRQPPPQQKDSDLLRKMQDAFANLMAKLKIPPRAGEGSRVSERGQDEGAQSARKEGQQQGREMPSTADAQGTPASDPQGARSQEAGQQAREGKGQGGDQASDRPGQEQARSGAGSKDGAKDLRQQEQLEAMGKLSEILGKRAENITGEVMIEVSSGDQRLRTAYSDSKAGHRAAGGEIHRDEVPLLLQPYVQRYFEEVRKDEARQNGQAQ
ncbi:MAG: hypothetical protein KIT09_07830 [Bryobacteraceae bacterium]|nr:hypothetical protein [Bryobacteraceae bacterium]